MNWSFWGMVAVFAASSFGAHADLNLKIMTFNLRYAKAQDGANSWSERKSILTDTIRKFSPDIIGTQECLDIQAEFIGQALPEYRWVGVGRDADGGGEMSATFYKKHVLSPIETGNFWISETPGIPGSISWKSSCTRMATWVRFRHLRSGKIFYHFNTHLDHKSEEARQQGARLIAERASELAGDSAVVVTGDFNAIAEESEAWRIFKSAGFEDAWLGCEKRMGPSVTFGNFGPPKAGSNERIDWILLKGGFKSLRCETIIHNEGGRYPSDHFPVMAQVEW